MMCISKRLGAELLYRRSFVIESKLDKHLDVFRVVLSNTVFKRLEHESVVNLHVNTVSAL